MDEDGHIEVETFQTWQKNAQTFQSWQEKNLSDVKDNFRLGRKTLKRFRVGRKKIFRM